MSKFYNIVLPKKYTVRGEEKTEWANVGTLIETDKGRMIKLNHINEIYQVFPVEEKNVKDKFVKGENGKLSTEEINDEIDTQQNIPF